jgi:Protein of unknown function (DUF1592)/Protein of unknown function (DUF1588)/Protein of unknown function (DUF1595)/Protein of unknown function (DUF1587)/Protein of unknown function (DUF1585)
MGLVLVTVAAAACVGEIGGADGPNGSGPGNPNDPNLVGGAAVQVTGPSTRLARLTHREYDKTVADLLKYTPATPPSAAFIADVNFAGYNNNADGLTVSDVLTRQYQQSAEALAAGAVAQSLSAIVPCTPTGDGSACAKQFIQTFGRRAFRRPLTDTETAAYLAAFTAAATEYASTNTFNNGVQFVVEAMLQSPNFLYRAELSQVKDSLGAIVLDDYEVASRLSYLFWGTMPDDALAALADGGQIHTVEQVRDQAVRLLADPRARDTVADFHAQWLQLSRYSTNFLTKNPTVYPNFPATMGPALQDEATRFVSSVVFDDKGSFGALLTAPYTFVNADTAKLYGVTGNFSSTMQKVQLDPKQRSGYLTQIGFLASHAYQDGDSPIHRGVFVQRQLLCTNIPPPPPGVNATLPPVSDTLKTTRDRVTAHTANAPCNGCHTNIINPAGFAFEHYDGIGVWRDKENNTPVDSNATLTIDGKDVSYTDAVDFAHKVADSQQARRCFVLNLMRYAYAHQETAADNALIDALTTKVTDPSYTVQSLLIDLTQTRSFLYRPADGS